MGRKKIFSREQILRVIHHSVVHQGMAPTIEELRRALGAGSTNTILRYLLELESEGYIKRWPGSRGIKLLKGVDGKLRTRAVPIAGVVPAGPLMLAEENLEGWIRLPEDFFAQTSVSQFFLLRVVGHSMNRAEVLGGKIEDEDLVLVRQQSTAEPGQIVVALIDGEATIKRLVKGPGYYVLKPESTKKYEPIVLDKETLIQGVVCRVLKQGSNIIRNND